MDLPYSFVPLSAWVYSPPWVDRITQDIPFKDGLSGTIEIELTVETPLLCGDSALSTTKWRSLDGREWEIPTVAFFQLPDGKPAIPGSTQRGLIRNVIEIAAFGRMKFIDADRRFGLRDISSSATAKALYQSRLVASTGQNPTKVHPLSKAGFLYFENGQWMIEPCSYARLPVDELAGISKTQRDDWKGRDDVVKRYGIFNKKGVSLTQTLYVSDDDGPHPHGPENRPLAIHYRVASRTGGHGWTGKKGQVVLTGKPIAGLGRKKKNLEFFFYDSDKSKAFPVDPDVMRGFLSIHAPGDEPKGWNVNWRFWNDKLRADPATRIPIFYIGRQSEGPIEAESFGLAMMFKLAHAEPVKTLLNNSRRADQNISDHLDESLIDLATAIFGEANDDNDDDSRPEGRGLKGRVSFSPARLVDGGTETETIGPLALMAPKPQYYPAYVRQPRQSNIPNRREGEIYASYTPVAAGGPVLRQPELAGWKVFPARSSYIAQPPLPEDKVNNPDKALRCLRPITSGTFRSKIRFHNLKPVELGAVLWAIEWGGNGTARHTLGMGKPLGLGTVALRITGLDSRPNHLGVKAPSKQCLIEAFTTEMARAYFDAAKIRAKWETSEQIRTLLAYAQPTPAIPYLTVQGYVEARNGGCVPAYPLPLTNRPPGDVQVFPRPRLE